VLSSMSSLFQMLPLPPDVGCEYEPTGPNRRRSGPTCCTDLSLTGR